MSRKVSPWRQRSSRPSHERRRLPARSGEFDPHQSMNTTARAWKEWLGEALAWAFGIIFIYSGCLKVGDPSQFLVSIRSFHFLPDPFAAWMALALPWLEIFAGLAVLTGWLR